MGFGLLAAHDKVVTCAHVVATALGLPHTYPEAPKEPVFLDFPLREPGRLLSARVASWTAMLPDGEGDVAGLLLEHALPEGAGPLVLARDDAVGDHPVAVYGYQRQFKDQPAWVNGTIEGDVHEDRLQIGRPAQDDGCVIQQGFSGTPVWDRATGRVIGLVSQAARPDIARYAQAIKGETILDSWTNLRAEYQRACPYRAFLPFTAEHSAVFFGRAELAAKTVRTVRTSEITIVTGMSGAGKTSLLQAAVVPRLEGDDRTAVLVLQPHLHETLRHALAAAVVSLTDPGAVDVRTRQDELADALVPLRPAALAGRVLGELGAGLTRLVLVVDQFELLLSPTAGKPGEGTTEPERLRRVAAELRRLATEDGPGEDGTPAARVVVAVTENLLETVLGLPGWQGTVRNAVVRVGPMTPQQLTDVLEGPLRNGIARFEDGLLDLIVQDIVRQRQTLPDVQALLTRMWHGQTGNGLLTTANYRELSGPEGWLSAHVEQIWAGLTEKNREASERLLLHLVEPGAGDGDFLRRFAARGELDEDGWKAAELLAQPDYRLVVISAGASGEPMAALSHDTLLAQWTSARAHLDAHRDLLRWRSELRRERAAWERSGHRSGYLPRRGALKNHRDALVAYQAYASETERQFVEAAEHHRRTWRWRSGVVLTVVLVLMAVGVTVFLALRRQAADDRRAREAVEIAEKSEILADADPVTSQLLAVAAQERAGGLPETRKALLQAAADRRRGTIPSGRYGGSLMAFDPAGTTLVTSGFDGRIMFWDTAEQRRAGPQPRADYATPSALAVSPDGRLLASGHHGGLVILWDMATRRPVGSAVSLPRPSGAPAGGERHVSLLAFAPQDNTLVASSSDRVLTRWDLRGSRPRLLDTDELPDFGGPLTLSGDGRLLAAADDRGGILLSDAHTGRRLGDLPADGRAPVEHLVFSPDGRRLAVNRGGNELPGIELWDVSARRQVGDLRTKHMGSITTLAFNPDGSLVATGSDDQQVELLDARGTGLPIGEPLAGHVGSLTGLVFAPDGRTLASAADDGTVRLWDPELLRPRETAMDDGSQQVLSAAFSPDGEILASGSATLAVHLWDPRTGRPARASLTGRMGKAFSVAFSENGSTLAATSDVGPAWLWDTTSWRPTGPPLEGAIGAVAFSPDGQLLATGDTDLNRFDVQGDVQLWDTATHRALEPLLPAHRPGGGTYPLGHRGRVHALAFSPDGKVLASGSGFGEIQLWDVAGRRALGEPMTDHSGDVTSLAFSPDGKRLASGATDGTVRLWDVAARLPFSKPLTGHRVTVNEVAFSRTGLLASGGQDSRVRLWDPDTGTQIGDPLLVDGGIVHALAFSRDGSSLAAGGARLHLWDVSALADPAKAVCARYPHLLSRATWHDHLPELPYRPGCLDTSRQPR
ncbi:trypsin-like peptidase domain-containing protein [Streptomyces sp. NPDC005017]|uniref:nSTAND1 domain-containing NTPase n=1 Tax=Streptomyces sp. NPDC005017 TaxID=3364706 RepID=UPI0036B123C9